MLVFNSEIQMHVKLGYFRDAGTRCMAIISKLLFLNTKVQDQTFPFVYHKPMLHT